MRCVAVIESDSPAIDSVILWTNSNTLIAFAYLDGRVKMTRPLAATSLEDGAAEVQKNFKIRVSRVIPIAALPDSLRRYNGPGAG